MAIQFVNNVDFNANQAQSIRIENVATDPSTELVIGRIIFNTAADTLKQYVADAGSGSPGWVEVGSSSGVETLTAAQGTFISFTAVTSETGDVDLGTFDLSAANTPDATKYLRGDNTWSAISGIYAWDIAGDTGTETVANGDTVTFGGGTYITTPYATGTNTLTINHDATTRSDTTSTDSPGYGGTFQAVTGVSTNATGHVTAIDVSTVTIPSAENYSWTLSADSGTNQSIGSGDTVDIEGGTNITTTVGATDKVTIDLDDDVSLSGSLTVGTTGSFTGQVTVPTATVGTNAPNLAQVQSLIAGVGVFQGGYNAVTNSPALTGGSNIALDQGDYFAVTDSNNTSFLGTILEVGDLIFANNDITASSTPTASDYTIVQSGQSIAGEGATDGATIKGIAGFNSAHFSVTTNGFVSADVATASTIGIGNVAASTDVEYNGLRVDYSSGTATVGLDIASIPAVTSTPSGPGDSYFPFVDDGSGEQKTITLENLAAEIDISKGVRISLDGSLAYVTRTEAGGLTTFAVAVNNSNVLGATTALDVKAEITTSGGQTVYADITRSGTTLSVIFTGSVANATYSALLVDVG